MKRVVFLYLSIFLVLTNLVGCIPTRNTLSKEEIQEQVLRLLKNENYSNVKNFKILDIKDYSDLKIVVFSYDIALDHNIGYRFLNIKGRKLEILGGGGGMAPTPDEAPFTFSTGSGTVDNKYFHIVYGEVYEPGIKKIRVTYKDGTIAETDVVNMCYIVATQGEGQIKNAIKVEGFDEQWNLVFKHPS